VTEQVDRRKPAPLRGGKAGKPPAQRRGRRPGRGDAAPSVDLADLNVHLGYLLRRAQLWVFQHFHDTLAPLDIRTAQYSVLTVINANPGLSQMALAHALGIERARLVHVLDSLERRHLLERVPSMSDRRRHAMHLTAEGRAFLRKAKDLVDAHERHVVRKFSAARHQQLLTLLSFMRHG
jgi:DNA-binding MarR family transcriptional regulator